MTKLFISGFPLEITEMELVQIVDPHCRVVTVKIVRDKKTRVCKGYAFIEVNTLEEAENAAIALDGEPIGDRFLTVNIVREEAVKKAPPSSFSRRPATSSSYTRVERQPAAAAASVPGMRPRRPRK